MLDSLLNWLRRRLRVAGRRVVATGQRLLNNIKSIWDARARLEITCQKLQKLLTRTSSQTQSRELPWELYAKALSLASICGDEQVNRVILNFDPLFGEETPSCVLPVQQGITVLLEAARKSSFTTQSLEAAWRLARRAGNRLSIQQMQQKICINLASIGDANALIWKLIERRQEGILEKEELDEILKSFLTQHAFEEQLPWKAFFREFQEGELPQIHQVYGVLDRYLEAADLAEASEDYRSSLRYLTYIPGKDAALRAIGVAERLGDQEAIAANHLKVAESLWEENNYGEALTHFQKAGNLERASDCQEKLGDLAAAIGLRPAISSEWRLDIREAMERRVRSYLDRQEFLEAVRLLHSVEAAWRQKSDEPDISSEADRTGSLLAQAVRTARSYLSAELSAVQGQTETEICKRWSQIEEAAGNYLEAGLQAEKAQDYFAASVLFEKAGAFGQALAALESAAPDDSQPQRKAELLFSGGDFFMAALLYERLEETDKAITAYEQAKEFFRAAELRQKQIGSDQAVFDDRFLDLLTQAERVEHLAELCATNAEAEERSPEAKARLFRRIQELGNRGLVGQKWLDRVASELPNLEADERSRFNQRANEWLQAATQDVLRDYINAFGLDLGTSSSVVSLYNQKLGQPEVVEVSGRPQIPSVFAIDQLGREIVGVPVSELLSKSPRAIVTQAKRKMGNQQKI